MAREYGFSAKKSIIRRLGGLQWSIIIFIALIAAFLFGINSISKDTTDRQQQALETAIDRSIVSCYCVEGTYPPSLDYIKQHYGLTYDESLFFVDYRPIGSNILPDVTVIRKEQ